MMFKKITIASLGGLTALTLIGCSNGNETPKEDIKIGENISVLNKKSYCFRDSVDLKNTAYFTTYKALGYGDVPYLNAEDLKEFISMMSDVIVDVSKEGSTVKLTKQSNENSYVIFDASKNEISFKNPSLLVDSSRSTIGHDYCLTAGNVIRSSAATKVGTVGKDEGKISLNDYNIKLFNEDGKVFVPYDLFNTLILPSSLIPYVYNGKDFVKNPNSYEKSDMTSVCFSGNGYFEYGFVENGYRSTTSFKKISAKPGHKYTYESINSDGLPSTTDRRYLALYSDGKGAILNSSNTEALDNSNKITRIKYVEEDNYITMYLQRSEQSSPIDPTEESFERKLVVYTGENRFAKTERSKETANFTYNLLCLEFDKVYSVKDAKNISSFDKFFTDNGYKDNLKSTNVRTYEDAMAKFLNTAIDDGHTSLVSPSIFDYPGNTQLTILNTKYPLTHSTTISNKADEYYSDRFCSHNFNSEGLKIVGDTAYLAFDKFISSFGTPSNFKSFGNGEDIDELRNTDTCGYIASGIIRIEAYNKDESNAVKVKNIVVDISANIGGDMTVLPYVAGIMTKDPKLCVGDSRTGQVVEYHYEADFSGDGTYGDSYADKYNFFLLTSDASFSCGSSLPSMLKGTNVKIIGKQGAGGASPITTFTDASGLVYKTSGQFGILYKDGDTYKTIEKGVPVDYELERSLWYDYENLTKRIDEIVKTLNK